MPKPIIRKFTALMHNQLKGTPQEALKRIMSGKNPQHKMGFGQKQPKGLRKHNRLQKAMKL